MKKLFVSVPVIVAMAMAMMPMNMVAMATGNGAPSGPHYNLNIIGVPKDKTADMTGNNGHRIFVKLDGKTKILLSESPDYSFQVLDANGTDGTASFMLPNPDPDGDGTTVYSVWARAVGKPGGQAVITTCATVVDTNEDVCSLESLTVTRTKGSKPHFENVSRQLLYIYVDITDDDIDNPRLYPLFDEAMYGYFWDYDNSGLKVLQLRFYEIPTDVTL